MYYSNNFFSKIKNQESKIFYFCGFLESCISILLETDLSKMFIDKLFGGQSKKIIESNKNFLNFNFKRLMENYNGKWMQIQNLDAGSSILNSLDSY